MKIWTTLMALALVAGMPCYAADSAPGPPRAKATTPSPAPTSTAGAVVPGSGPSSPDLAASQGKTDLRFVAVEIEGVKFWLGGGDIDIKEFRASKAITFRLLNKLDGEHGFAIDTLKIKQIVKAGDELTFSVPLDDLDQSLSVYRYYCHLHPGHWGGTGVITGKEGPARASVTAPSRPEPARGKESATGRVVEEPVKPELKILKGKLLKIEKGFYVIESAPGKEVRVSAPLDSAVDDNGKSLIGEWMEVQISSDLHVTSIKKSAARYTIEGELVKIDGDTYVLTDASDNDVQLKVTRETRVDGAYRIGDKIKAEFTPDGYATVILKKTLPSQAPTEAPTAATPEKTLHRVQEVLKLDRAWAGALVRRDTMLLERAMADDGIATAWRIDALTKPQYLAEIASGDFAFKSIEIDGVKARSYGDAVLVTGRYNVTGRYKEQDISGQHRYTNVYIKQQGGWRLVSQDIHAQPQ